MVTADSKHSIEEVSNYSEDIQDIGSPDLFPWSLNGKVVAAKDVLMQDLAGESVLLSMQTEQYFGLDDVGTRMWQVLTEQASIQSAIEVLLGEYDVEAPQLEQDVKQLVHSLVEENLVEVADS